MAQHSVGPCFGLLFYVFVAGNSPEHPPAQPLPHTQRWTARREGRGKPTRTRSKR
jgi:hypothetical protein